MRFDEFARDVEEAGLEARRCSADHWQIRAGKKCRLVNVWADTKRGFRWQPDGQKSRGGCLDDAIAAAGPRYDTLTGEDERAPWEERPKRERVGLIRWLWRLIW